MVPALQFFLLLMHLVTLDRSKIIVTKSRLAQNSRITLMLEIP